MGNTPSYNKMVASRLDRQPDDEADSSTRSRRVARSSKGAAATVVTRAAPASVAGSVAGSSVASSRSGRAKTRPSVKQQRSQRSQRSTSSSRRSTARRENSSSRGSSRSNRRQSKQNGSSSRQLNKNPKEANKKEGSSRRPKRSDAAGASSSTLTTAASNVSTSVSSTILHATSNATILKDMKDGKRSRRKKGKGKRSSVRSSSKLKKSGAKATEPEPEAVRPPAASMVLRDQFFGTLQNELMGGMKLLLEATFEKKGRKLGQWMSRFFRLENDGSKPILMSWLNVAQANSHKTAPRAIFDVSHSKVVRVSDIEIEIHGAFDLQKVDDNAFPLANKKVVKLKLRGGADAVKSLGDIVETYVKSAEDGIAKQNRKFAAVSHRPSTFSRKYELLEELGRGGFAVVYKAKERATGKFFAVKELQLTGFDDPEALKRHLKGVENEIKIMSIATKVFPDNPNLLKLRATFNEPGQSCIYIVVDLCSGGELFDRIVEKQKYTEKDAALVFYDTSKALALLHRVGIVHRDLKPENIIFASPEETATLKIIDFGAAYMIGREEDDIHRENRIGSPGYFAPEVYRCKYGLPGDIFSMGVILFCLLVGYPPFDGDSDAETMMKVITCQYEFDEDDWAGISEEVKDLIKSMLKSNPADRPTIEEVLKHKWFEMTVNTKGTLKGTKGLDNVKGRLKQYKSSTQLHLTVSALNGTRRRMQQEVVRMALGNAVANAAKTKNKEHEHEADRNSNVSM